MPEQTAVPRTAVLSELEDEQGRTWKYLVDRPYGKKVDLTRKLQAARREIALWVDKWRADNPGATEDATVPVPPEVQEKPEKLLRDALDKQLVRAEGPDGEALPVKIAELRDDHVELLLYSLVKVNLPEEVMAELPTGTQ